MKRFLKLFASLSALVLSVLSVKAQNQSVTGRVVDETGQPLIAVTVYQDGNTTNGTVTDGDGNYTISVPTKATLVFSCLGFEEVRQNVASRAVINVTMKEEKLAIDAAEVVSIGYGSVTRRDLTGSVSKVDMEDIMKTQVTNFDQALAGRVAGVVVTTSDGALGAEANITIRGNNSLTQSSAPLYIIDGFPSESSMATALNSADIESIDILKDASATAIYGARGANGVIVITTKQGVEGKPKVNFTASWSGNMVAKKVDMMDAYDFVCFQTDQYNVSGSTNIYLKGEDGTNNFYSLEDYRNVESIDWQDQIYRNAFVQNYNVSLSGGSKTAGNRYNVSFSATDQDGVIVNSNFQRYQGKVNFSQKLGKKVQFDLMANYSRAVTNGVNPTSPTSSSSASGWLMYSVWGYRPTKPISQMGTGSLLDDLIDEGISDSSDYRFNPAKTVRNEYRKTIIDYLQANASLTWDITSDLKLKVSGGYNMYKRRREEFNGTQTYTGYEGSTSSKGINGAIYWNDKTTWLNENTLTWTKHIKRNHHLQTMIGFTMQGETYDYKGTRSEKMSTDELGINGMHTGSYQSVTPWQYDWRMMSGLFRLNYNYKYKYYLTASFRADGSSKFPTHNRWGYFPSAGLSWNFNRENWLKNEKWLSNGKLRASWGMTGNNRTSTPYDYYYQISSIKGSANSYDYVFNGQIVSGYFPSNMSNEKLKWETTAQWNIGLDVGFFDGRLKATVDWYLKDTYDLLLNATIPASSGYTSAMMNIGSMRNRGWEFTIDATPVKTRKFEWDVNVNLAINRNIVTGLNENQYSLFSAVNWEQKFNSQYPYITQVGKPSGMMYGFIYEGTYKLDEFQNGSTLKAGIPYLTSVGRDGVKPGDPKYRDLNEDGVIDDNDRTVIGCGQPLATGGFSTAFRFYGFDLNLFFQWSYGNDILNANRLMFENGTTSSLNQFSSYRDRFDAQRNPDSDIPAVQANGMFVYSSRVIEDGSYLRLKNISLGYTFPRSVLRKMKFDTVRVYLSADNVYTFTKYSGPDPEVSTRNSVLTPGFDWSAYPRAFGITGGVSFTF